MAAELTHEQIQGLLGAYALDAVEADEAAVIALHVRDCAECQAEVDTHREVAAMLASEPVALPLAPWDRIVADLGFNAKESDAEPRQPRPMPTLPGETGAAPGAASAPTQGADVIPLPRQTTRWRWITTVAAAVLLIAVVSLGAFAVHQQHRINSMNRSLSTLDNHQTLAEAAARAGSVPGARNVELRDTTGRPVANVVLLQDGTGYLIRQDGMTALPADHTYQLWGVSGDVKVSLGVLGSSPNIAQIGVPNGITALAITDEHNPGVISSTHAPLALASI